MSNKQTEADDVVFEGRIAQIIDDHRIVLNKGREHGVRIGQRFLILAIGDEIFDPETHESLGQVEVVKGRGEVTHVQEKMSTLQTTETHEIRRKPSTLFALTQGAEVAHEPKAFIDPEIGDIARRL
ncbi:hypothetical protein [Marinobacter halotolerans]|uniref:hypothetical protein n=1 Tax=Marinobacter halotolerans TaxID=1569211 RepID=UPI001248C720|nr:hypothetical protein [Marinobacter halotolerans]